MVTSLELGDEARAVADHKVKLERQSELGERTGPYNFHGRL